MTVPHGLPVAETADRLKVGILIPRLTGGGAEFVALEWASYLRLRGHEAVIITTHGGSETSPGLPAVALTKGSFPARVLELRRHLRSADYDVLLALMPHWNVLALAATVWLPAAPPVVISGRSIVTALKINQSRMYQVERLLARLLYRRAAGYVAISHPVAAEAVSRYGIPLDRLWVVPNPATGKVPGGGPHALRGHDGPDGRQTVTLTVPARLVRVKRPEMAVETAAVLRDRYGVDAVVDYFGHGPEEELVQTTARRLAVDIRLRGWVTAWFDEAAADAIVLLPSIAEGFGNVLVEAAAVGIPSVTSSRALGVADAVVPQVTGMLALGSSAEDYAAAVIEAMTITPVVAPRWLTNFSPVASGDKLLAALRATVTASRGRTDGPTASTVGPPPVLHQEAIRH